MIDWGIVQEQAKRKADEYAKRICVPQSVEFAKVSNAYYDAYMENAAEREGLRQINARLQKAELTGPVERVVAMSPALAAPYTATNLGDFL